MRQNLLLLALLAISALTIVSCSEDNDGPTTADMTITEVLADDSRFSTLLTALQRVDADSILDLNGSFTLFAPTNDAFTGVDISRLSDIQLSNILLYHVLGDDVESGDFTEGITYTSTASSGGYSTNSPTAIIEKSGTNITINGSISVTEADIETRNGVIHIIDGVMTPMNIFEIVSSDPQLSQLTDALNSSPGDLPDILAGSGPLSIFAPVNAAFQTLSGTLSGLTPEQIAEVLKYHIVNRHKRTNLIVDGDSAETLQMEEITVNIGNNITITDARGNVAEILVKDLQGTNGVVQVINMILLPENL
jgi:transforming growth factor-beta-induced protein